MERDTLHRSLLPPERRLGLVLRQLVHQHRSVARIRSGRDTGEVVTALVPSDLSEGTGHLDFDETAFGTLVGALGFDPADVGGLRVAFGGSVEASEGKVRGTVGDRVGEEREWRDEADLAAAVG